MTYFYEPNDAYFTKHLSKWVKAYGGKWVVIAGGSLIGVAHEEELKKSNGVSPQALPQRYSSNRADPSERRAGVHSVIFRYQLSGSLKTQKPAGH
jgi:hypothetical protein